MSHLSDFSYVDRGLTMLFMFFWIIFRVIYVRGVKSLNIFKKECRTLKVVTTYLVFVSVISMIIYDMILSEIKYEEGYKFFNDTGEIETKPKEFWSKENRDKLYTTGVLINIGFTFKSSAHFLTLAFFNSIAKLVVGKSFQSSFEFKAYRIYAIFSVAMYPLLQGVFESDPLYTVIVPQIWYHFECLAIIVLTLLTNARLKKLTSTMQSSVTVSAISYYVEINYYIVIFVALEFVGLGSINFDLLEEPHHVKDNKLIQDSFTHLFDIGMPFSLGGMIMLLYPAKRFSPTQDSDRTTAVQYLSPDPSINVATSNTSGDTTFASTRYVPTKKRSTLIEDHRVDLHDDEV